MKESYDEGLANHIDPESCVGDRKIDGEALTGAHADQVSSCEIIFGTPTPLSEAEGKIGGGDRGEPATSPAQSQTLSMYGNFLHGNRETPRTSSEKDGSEDRSEKATCPTSDMHVPGESDDRVVPEQSANDSDDVWSLWERTSTAKVKWKQDFDTVRGRRSTKGNTNQPAASRTQSRKLCALSGLDRVREVARRDKRAKFTALLHHVTVDSLRDSFHALKREAAPGVDGVTWQQYEVRLEDRLVELHRQIHVGTYRAQPSKRAYIPRPDGRMRPLGIAALEDKMVQHAVVQVLNAIYEEDFLGFSYGFRPGRSQHDALDALWVGTMGKKVNWVLDADIRGFFDTIDHEWLMKFVEHRIADPRICRLIRKWLRAGVSEDGRWSETKVGTPQGAVASPLLANVYLHYVLDLWVNQWRRQKADGECIIIRWADDFVMGFQHKREAERFLIELKARMERFGLSLHPEKTRLIEFGRFADQNRRWREGCKPQTFDFLGFTHICGKKHWSGGFIVKRLSSKKRMRAKLVAIKQTLMRMRSLPISQQGRWLRAVVQGWLNYHAVPGNCARLSTFRLQASRLWLRSLRRRSQRYRMSWDRFAPLSNRWIPNPKVLHPYPNDRFYAKHPK
jgi:group II intron reverse transcriptase/maturase